MADHPPQGTAIAAQQLEIICSYLVVQMEEGRLTICTSWIPVSCLFVSLLLCCPYPVKSVDFFCKMLLIRHLATRILLYWVET